MNFPSITIQGNIISTESLDKISKEEINFQKSADFGFKKDVKVRDEIGLAYAMIRGYWNSFKLKIGRLGEEDSATTETRNLWMIPFLTELGYTIQKSNGSVSSTPSGKFEGCNTLYLQGYGSRIIRYFFELYFIWIPVG